MTTFKEIQGRNIKSVSSDPANPGEGEMWYNNSIGILKGVQQLEAWSSASPLIGVRLEAGQFGSQTSSVAAGGLNPAISRLTTVEEYNGSGWSSGTALGTAFYRGGACGTQTTGLIFGGEPPVGDTNATLEYDGSTWTSGGNMGTARRTSGAGAQTSANAVGGYNNVNKLAATEEYDGSTWTAGANMPLATITDSANGVQTSTRSAAGIAGPGTSHPPASPQTSNANVAYDGNTWTTDTNTPSSLYTNSGSGQNADNYMSIGGRLFGPNALLNTVSKWDGTSWTAAPNIATARFNGQGIQGSSTATLFAGGSNSPPNATNLTEEYNKSATVITPAAWSSGGNLGTARYGLGTTGEPNSLVANAGTTGSATTATEEYNGSSWSSGGAVNTARFYVTDFGNSQTSAVMVNGRSTPETFMNDVEEYNGTSWTTVTDSPFNANNVNSFGTLTAGVIAGGNNPGIPQINVAEYDGTNWTSGTSLPSIMKESITGGTQTAGFVASGGPGPSNNVNHFQYDGTNWTTAGNVNQARQSAASGGTQAAAIGGSGYAAPLIYLTSTSIWDGTTWYSGASVATGRYAGGKGSTSTAAGTSAVLAGGQAGAPTYINQVATEEYNGETTALNIKTFTTS